MYECPESPEQCSNENVEGWDTIGIHQYNNYKHWIGKLRQNFFPLARAEMRGEKEEKVESKTVLGLITKSLKS
jgi:hypothetical protein